MLTHVEFCSDSFAPYPGEEEDINPGRWGKKISEYIYEGLKAQGFNVAEPTPEDWGWKIDVQNDLFPIWIGCGNYDEYPNGFLCFIEPSQPFVRKFILQKINTEADVQRVQKAMDLVLSNEPSITGIRWQTASEFNEFPK